MRRWTLLIDGDNSDSTAFKGGENQWLVGPVTVPRTCTQKFHARNAHQVVKAITIIAPKRPFARAQIERLINGGGVHTERFASDPRDTLSR